MSTMKVTMTEESNDSDSNSFLLDDSSRYDEEITPDLIILFFCKNYRPRTVTNCDFGSSIPFSVEDMCSSIKIKDITTVTPPAELLEKEAFQFLQE